DLCVDPRLPRIPNPESRIPLLVWKHPRELRRVRLVDHRRAAQAALALGALAAQDVLLERFAPQELAALGALEALGGPAVGFEFRHATGSSTESPLRTPRTQKRMHS